MSKVKKEDSGYYEKILNEISRKYDYKDWFDVVSTCDMIIITKVVKSAMFYEAWEQTLNLSVENSELKQEIKKFQKYFE